MSIKYRNYTIEIIHDDYADNPREIYDHIGSMVCFHRRYCIGDKHSFSIEDLKEKIASDDYYYLPIYMMDHSGISISSTSYQDKWDSGQVGYIILSKEKAMEENIPAEHALNVLQNEIVEYNSFLTGETWGYQIISPKGEELDSCYSFYGEINDECYMVIAAKHQIDYYITHEQKTYGIQQELQLV